MSSHRSLTVVIAAYNEEAALPVLQPRLRAVLDSLQMETRVLYVDDGSRDGTWQVLQDIAARDRQVALLRLSRNFGKEAALTAGLDLCVEGAVMILDADGQDPPELIPEFVARWREGWDDVYGLRTEREGDGWARRGAAAVFYRLIGRLSHTPVPADTGDYRLLSPRALAALARLRERHRFMKGLFGWVGYRRLALPYRRAPRLVPQPRRRRREASHDARRFPPPQFPRGRQVAVGAEGRRARRDPAVHRWSVPQAPPHLTGRDRFPREAARSSTRLFPLLFTFVMRCPARRWYRAGEPCSVTSSRNPNGRPRIGVRRSRALDLRGRRNAV